MHFLFFYNSLINRFLHNETLLNCSQNHKLDGEFKPIYADLIQNNKKRTIMPIFCRFPYLPPWNYFYLLNCSQNHKLDGEFKPIYADLIQNNKKRTIMPTFQLIL